MFKKILVATDASEYSRHAFETAVELAKQFQSEIVLLHVVDQPPTYYYKGLAVSGVALYSDHKINELGQQVLDATIANIDASPITISRMTASGNAAQNILAKIENDIDLVVMGSRGHGPIVGALTGSVTLRVLAHAPCPVLVVR